MQYETQNKTEPFLSDTEAKFTDLDESFETKLDQAARERTLKEKLVEWKNRLFRPITSGSMRGSIFCLLCITFGSGILSLPYAIKLCGLVLTIIIFITAAFLIYTTLNLLCDAAYKCETIDYLSLVNKCFGPKIMTFTSLANLLSNFGSVIVYQQIISNFFFSFIGFLEIDPSLGLTPFWSRCLQMYIFCIFTQLPICLIRDISILHKFSIVGTCSLLYVVSVTIVEFPWYFNKNFTFERLKLFDFNVDILKVFCMFFFSFGNHNAILNVVKDLKNPTIKRGKKVVHYSFYIEFFVYLTTMLIGYFSTFEQTNEIFIDRPNQSFFLLIGKMFYILALTCHIGMFYYISKPSLQHYFNNDEDFSTSKNVIVCSFSLLTLNTIGVLCESVSSIMAIIGATALLYLVFICPSKENLNKVSIYLKTSEHSISEKMPYIIILVVTGGIGFSYVSLTFLRTFKYLF